MASRGPTDSITFDTAKRLDDFVFFPRATAGRTDGRSLLATLVEDWRRSPLIQMKIAWRLRFTVLAGRDLYVSTRFMTNSSKIDRAAGVFARFRSPDDYYAVRARSKIT
jgi:hypothetical protein